MHGVKQGNTQSEGMAYKEFEESYTTYTNALQTYDTEMNEFLREKANQDNMLNEQKEYLAKQRELWQERQDEVAKRKEMDLLLKRKKEE